MTEERVPLPYSGFVDDPDDYYYDYETGEMVSRPTFENPPREDWEDIDNPQWMERYEPDALEAAGETPGFTPANSCGAPGTWPYDFAVQHGRCPNEQDVKDRQWSEQFAATYGHPPTEADWNRHYYSSRGGNDDDAYEGTVGYLMDNMEFPETETAVPPYLRGWVKYLQQAMTQNPELGIIPLPELVQGQVADLEVEGGGPETREEAGQTAPRASDTLQGLLGFPQGEEELGSMPPVQQWQRFLQALENAPIEAQQQLVGLRYDPNLADEERGETGWYEEMQPLLPNPKYL